MLTVKDMMTPNPHTLLATDTLADAKHLMQEKQIRHVPIVSANGELEGLITSRDILAAQSSTLEKNQNNQDLMQSTLASFVERNLYTVSPRAGLKEAALYMQKHQIGCLPVVAKDKLIGIITDTDFITIAITLLEIQEESDSKRAGI